MSGHVSPGAVVVPTADLAADVDTLRDEAGFRLDRIMPADDPELADLSGHGVALRLRAGDAGSPIVVEVDGDPRTITLSGGSAIHFAPAVNEVVVPDGRPELVASHASDGDAWVTGRAGMRYRDLLPGRWGGRFIASHIHVPGTGPLADYVHFHRIRLQLIAVKRGQVEVVYEDQGPPFVMKAGDCVLQPPEIRHRVLHSWDDLEVVEVGCPAEHETLVDHDLDLPTAELYRERDYSGQRFVRHIAAETTAGDWRLSGWTARDSGIDDATSGLFSALFVRPADDPSEEWSTVESEFEFLVTMCGSVVVETLDGGRMVLAEGDSIALPSGQPLRLLAPSPDLELMEVHVP